MAEKAGVVAITGASSGIGAASALQFAAAGYDLVLGARRFDALEAVAGEASSANDVTAIAVACDVRHEADCRAFVSTAADQFGRLDVLICNAGIGFYGRVEDTTTADFRDLVETNLLGVHNCLRAALPLMREQRSGHLVVVSSVAGKQSWADHGPYSATKFALVGLTQALRAELAGSGVTASLVLPATTATPFFARAKVARGRRPAPFGRMQTADEVARAILKTVHRPSPEVNLRPSFRLFFTIAEAVPHLPDAVRRWAYLRHRRQQAWASDR